MALTTFGTVAGLPGSAFAAKAAPKSPDLPKGEFHQDVDDIRMYCRTEGEGPLLIVQTGIWTLSTAGKSDFVTALAKHFTVLTFDARGQGRTSYGKCRATYGRLASDTVRLMDKLGIERADFFGHSDGGCIELDLLLNFEDRIRSAVLSGTPNDHEAYSTETRAVFAAWYREMKADSNIFIGFDRKPMSKEVLNDLESAYHAVSPNPETFWQAMKDRRRSWSTEPDVSLRRLAAIRRPVLVLSAGADEYIPQAALDRMAAAIPGAERMDLPTMTHDYGPQTAEIVARMHGFITRVEQQHG